jgi:phenylacetate-CoA ligase
MSLLGVYHKLPPALRSVAASGHGYYLRSLRYSRHTEALVAEALEQESWSRQQWESWRQEHLARLLDRAVRHVPYYREHWANRRRAGDRRPWESLENWPVLEKEVLRQTPRAFVAEDAKSRLHLIQTSGTTGTPLQLWQSRETLTAWYALVEARSRRWYGVSGQDRWAILGGKLVAPVSQDRPPFWVWNQGLRQLYLSSYHLMAQWIPNYVTALRQHRVAYLWGYTSSLFTLAQEMLAQQLTGPELKVVITNAEPLHDYQREIISKAFRCPVRETYGMAEMAAAAGECEAGRLHLWPSVGLLEVLQGDQPVPAGETGDLVCTGLLNVDMPLIRYRVGDRGRVASLDRVCACRRNLPVVECVEGRMDDVIQAANGRRIGRMDPILKGNIAIKELQFIQETRTALRVKYVAARGFDAHAKDELVERIRQYVGDFNIQMEQVDRIPRGANGKFRQVICNLPPVSGRVQNQVVAR